MPVWAGAKAAAPARREAKMAVFMVVNKLALYSRDREMRVVTLYTNYVVERPTYMYM